MKNSKKYLLSILSCILINTYCQGKSSDILSDYFDPNLGASVGFNVGVGVGSIDGCIGDWVKFKYDNKAAFNGSIILQLNYNRHLGIEFDTGLSVRQQKFHINNHAYKDDTLGCLYKVSVLGRIGIPLNNKLELHGKCGYGVTFNDLDYDFPNIWGLLYGASLEYRINRTVSLTLNWLRSSGGRYNGVLIDNHGNWADYTLHISGENFFGIGVNLHRFSKD